ncbi:C6 zinc finger domain protein [Aspergillus arachidicola]|uniref:C6 zinc finger domain protein n=1 Tax=Aspergillus arachidicola TaxID=656916 RepID=A0A2G7FK55_9EURO|nr:C6 zinc finger domain protein [Aspergillus arachidicola]
MADKQTKPNSKSRRTSSTRSRTGCRTCRARHLKCDESPGACRNCTSTGRTCDGYDLYRLPITRTKVARAQITPALVDGLRWVMTSDERRCFSHFQYHTIPTLLALYDSLLWQKLVLQMSYSEPAVYHATNALSAIHQDIEMNGIPLPGQDVDSPWHRFALEQSSRSISFLTIRHATSDPHLQSVVLLCCLLFVMQELLRGHYDSAYKHLQSGVRILRDLKADTQLISGGATKTLFDQCLVGTFLHLDSQLMYGGVGGPLLSLDGELKCALDESQDIFGEYNSLQEVRHAFSCLLRRHFRFLSRTQELSAEDIKSNYEALHLKQQQILSQLYRVAWKLEAFSARSYTQLTEKDQRGLDMIDLALKSITLGARRCFIRSDSLVKLYTPEYDALVSEIEDVMCKLPDRPSMVLDVGVIIPLYYVALGCNDYGVRRRAIRLLRSWPHFEGAFDSNMVALVAEELIKAEQMMEDEYQPESCITDEQMEPMASEERQAQITGDSHSKRWPAAGENTYSLDDCLKTNNCLESWPCIQRVSLTRCMISQGCVDQK